jgi:hypothetical protein
LLGGFGTSCEEDCLEEGKKGKTTYNSFSTPSLAILEEHASSDYGMGFAI